MGRGFNPYGNQSVDNKAEEKITGNQELESLRAQAEKLNQQMQAILKRIDNLEKI